jgi:hypothetical protein
MVPCRAECKAQYLLMGGNTDIQHYPLKCWKGTEGGENCASAPQLFLNQIHQLYRPYPAIRIWTIFVPSGTQARITLTEWDNVNQGLDIFRGSSCGSATLYGAINVTSPTALLTAPLGQPWFVLRTHAGYLLDKLRVRIDWPP